MDHEALCLREDDGLCACGDGAPPQLRVVAAQRAQRGRAHAGRVARRRRRLSKVFCMRETVCMLYEIIAAVKS